MAFLAYHRWPAHTLFPFLIKSIRLTLKAILPESDPVFRSIVLSVICCLVLGTICADNRHGNAMDTLISILNFMISTKISA